ncbi:MAG: hypothetical protein JO167_04475 [Alphaproteobacteria bacterium]|nr:hypothetical protein [Alphaproteobacteria bacterium]MBV9540500.1 hypothetical protein [Alphaproteobacteria bacterium]MBV9904097.1 hypothetical protein [Alphaproteobacteria bacterium]
MAIHLDQPMPSPAATAHQWWRVFTVLLMAALFVQGVFAGAMLSGFEWARPAHAANGFAIVIAAFLASLLSFVALRRTPNGVKYGFTLLALAIVIFVQFALGRLAARGANLMWLHVPLGVALVGLAGQAMARARLLGHHN